MRQKLRVFVEDGIPVADVPPRTMWDLVQHLAEERVTVSYHFRGTHFAVRFLATDARRAQQVLDAWAGEAAGAMIAA